MADQDKDPIQLLVDTLAENQNQLARLLETSKTLSAKIEILSAHQDKIGKTVEQERKFTLTRESAITLSNGLLEATKADRTKLTATAEQAIRQAGSSSVFTAGQALLERMDDKLSPLALASRQLQAMQDDHERMRGDRLGRRWLIASAILFAFMLGVVVDTRFFRLDREAWRIVHIAPVCKDLGGRYIPPKDDELLGGCWFPKPSED